MFTDQDDNYQSPQNGENTQKKERSNLLKAVLILCVTGGVVVACLKNMPTENKTELADSVGASGVDQDSLTDLSLIGFQNDPSYKVLNYGLGQMNPDSSGQGIPNIDPFSEDIGNPFEDFFKDVQPSPKTSEDRAEFDAGKSVSLPAFEEPSPRIKDETDLVNKLTNRDSSLQTETDLIDQLLNRDKPFLKISELKKPEDEVAEERAYKLVPHSGRSFQDNFPGQDMKNDTFEIYPERQIDKDIDLPKPKAMKEPEDYPIIPHEEKPMAELPIPPTDIPLKMAKAADDDEDYPIIPHEEKPVEKVRVEDDGIERNVLDLDPEPQNKKPMEAVVARPFRPFPIPATPANASKEASDTKDTDDQDFNLDKTLSRIEEKITKWPIKPFTSGQEKASASNDFCQVEEQFNKNGAYRCTTSLDCKGKKICNEEGWCTGQDMCPLPHPCYTVEQGSCETDQQCRGDRTCNKAQGQCEGFSGCPSDKKCAVNESLSAFGNGKCQFDFQCQGLRTCSKDGLCQGVSGCAIQSMCDVDETITQNKCSTSLDCVGKRKCVEGKCFGQSLC